MCHTNLSQIGWVWGPSGRDFGVEEPKFAGVYCEAARSGPYDATVTCLHSVYFTGIIGDTDDPHGPTTGGEIPYINMFSCRHAGETGREEYIFLSPASADLPGPNFFFL